MKKKKKQLDRMKMKILSIIVCMILVVTTFVTYAFTFGLFTTSSDGNGVSTGSLSGVNGDTVTVDDEEADWNYYMGLNYTSQKNQLNSSGTLSTITYSKSNLVRITTTYDSSDILDSSLVGYVSTTERQSKYIYYKYYEVVGGYVEMDLIDNPFTDRPIDKGFNGWTTNYRGAVISFDQDYYIRRVKIPVTYTNGIPNDISISFNASWVDSSVSYITGNTDTTWSDAFSGLLDVDMISIDFKVPVYENVSVLYYENHISNRQNYPNGAYIIDDWWGLTSVSGQRCRTSNGCYYYTSVGSDEYDPDATYYKFNTNDTGDWWDVSYSMDQYTVSQIGEAFSYGLDENDILAGYYEGVLVNYGDSYAGYYDNLGIYQEGGTCSDYNGCKYYNLIQYYDGDNINYISLDKEYYYLVTRDTNFVVLQSNLTSSWSSNENKPFTLTSIYNGQSSTDKYWNVNDASINCYADTVIENIYIYSTQGFVGSGGGVATGELNKNKYFYGNWFNTKIGRGLVKYKTNNVNFISFYGGSNTEIGSQDNIARYSIIVESGLYSFGSTIIGAVKPNVYVSAKAIYGCDYDRVLNDNSKLTVTASLSTSFGGNVYSTSNQDIAAYQNYKSGSFGTSGKGVSNANTLGIYYGQRESGFGYAKMIAKIDGGWYYVANGGSQFDNNSRDIDVAYLYVTGGEITSIFGGAGSWTTYGNRYIQVTGGLVDYSVIGGSNAYASTSNAGTLYGSSYVYIGGIAQIGDATRVKNNNTLWNAEAGSVFGNGAGGVNASTAGSNSNAYVIIDGDAHILRNVYGGSNNGQAGSTTSTNVTNVYVNVLSGKIDGSIYGGGNNNGVGGSKITANININVYGGTIGGSIYGGSRSKGIIYGSVNVNVNKGSIGSAIYGGGEGGYSSDSSKGTYVLNDVNVNIGKVNDSNDNISIGSVYGGSAYGTVNGSAISTKKSAFSTKVIINSGVIGSVYGSAKGSSSITPYTEGDVSVDINGGVITDVFGGNNLAGVNNGDVKVNVYNGTITNAYGGGNQAVLTTSNLNLYGGSVDNAYGGGNQSGVTTSNVLLSGSTSQYVFGGSNKSGEVGISNVTFNSGSVTAIYGGNNLGGSTGKTNVEINSSDVSVVYGGGEKTDVTTSTNVFINKSVDNVFGGSNTNGEVEASYVNINNTACKNVYGGNNLGGSTNTTNVNIDGGSIDNVYGGGLGLAAGSNSSNINMYYGYVDNMFGGGSQASVDTTHINLNKGTINNIYGGSNTSGDVGTSYIKNASNDLSNSAIVVNSTFTSNNINVSGATGISSSETVTTSITNNTGVNLITWDLYIFFNDCLFDSNWTEYNIQDEGGLIHIDEIDQWYGTNPLTNGTSYNINYNVHSHETLDNFKIIGYSFIGYDSNGNEYKSNSFGSLKVSNVYGGNNLGGNTDVSNITFTEGTFDNIFGGGKKASTGKTNVDLSSDAIINNNIYGGGDEAEVTGNTKVDVKNISVPGTIYGGGNNGDVGGNTDVTLNGIIVSGNIYGGGNAGSVDGTTNLTITDIYELNNIYGGGDAGDVGADTVLILTSSSINDTLYGGGREGKVNGNTTITLDDVDITNNIFGGGYAGDVIGSTNVALTNNSNVLFVYGGGNEGAVSGNTIVNLASSSVNDTVYGGGKQGKVDGNTTITLDGAAVTNNIYGGGLAGDVLKNTGINLDNNSNVNSIYGGGYEGNVNGNAILNLKTSLINDTVYGGGKAGKVIGNTDVTLNGITVTNNVFAGGDAGDVGGNTSLKVNSAIITKSLYGGGNEAGVIGSTSVIVKGSTINDSAFGGGNFGYVKSNTSVYISGATINGSIYAGGNGSTAYVIGNTLLNIDDNTSVVSNVFGGGNAASVGCENIITLDDGSSIGCANPNKAVTYVNIAGANIGGNVYGGANTSKLFGIVYLNIGSDSIDGDYNLIASDIDIRGTVFGGGEANASGSEDYDFKFISVTKGININIDAKDHDEFNIEGSIFGSGNASSSGGYSYITISNYGTFDNYEHNISIQRADVVTMNNSAIELSGATDRTNEYKTELFTLSRVNELRLKNGSTLFLDRGANLLSKLTSLVTVDGEDVKASVSIDSESGTVTKNVDNRIYMAEGRNLNISDSETLTSYGEVDGMTFFGMFTIDRTGKVATALYKQGYDYGDEVNSSELYYFSSGSYVVGLHKNAHDYLVDGFYSNYANEDGESIYVDYIEPTPPQSSYYRWVIGEDVSSIEVSLTASKYSSLGTYELQLLDYYTANTEISIIGVNYDGLDSDISLLREDDIPRVARSVEDANTNFGLAMKSGNTGWITVGSTEFITSGNGITGTDDYISDNSTDVPSYVFYLFHSKNLTETKDMGYVTISLMVATPISDLSNKIERVNIVVNLSTALYEGDNYEATINVGSQYSMFANSAVNIVNDGVFSAYYSLYATSEDTIYKSGYYRSLVSSYVLPIETKITMIDFASGDNPEYYYYVVNETDYNNAVNEYNSEGEVSYYLSKFVRMGSSSSGNTYSDIVANSLYYNEDNDTATEEFIFIVDFGESAIYTNELNKSLLIELRNPQNSAVIPVLGIEQEKMVYNLYENSDATVTVSGRLSSDSIYVGNAVTLDAVTDFVQDKTASSAVIYDTNYFDEKMGIKLSIYDENGNLVNGASLLGVSFIYNGNTYYPRIDGTVRFNIAERIANVNARIKINTKNSNLASGKYKIFIESFGSSDGVYYGLQASSSTTVDLTILNSIYGLEAELSDKSTIVDAETGLTLNGDNKLDFTLNYASGLVEPVIRVSLYRRNYDDAYSMNYDLVDLKDYLVNCKYPNSDVQYEYIADDNPHKNTYINMELGSNLKTGTYKIMFSLYDKKNFIGNTYKYIIIE